MPALSAILIVRNEAGQLEACLDTLRGLADEIVIVDDQSTDGTPELARRFTRRLFQRTLDSYGRQKQFALDQAAGDWVLSIDADERVTPRLREEILSVLRAPRADGYVIRREVFFLGRQLRHGGLERDRVLRLFRRGRGRFTEDAVHERAMVEGRIQRLRAPLEHHPHRSLARYVEKVNRYTSLSAGERHRRGRRFHFWMLLRPPFEFFARYVLRLGFLDGQAGLIYAGLSAHASWLRALKLRELERTAGSPPELEPN